MWRIRNSGYKCKSEYLLSQIGTLKQMLVKRGQTNKEKWAFSWLYMISENIIGAPKMLLLSIACSL